MDSIAALRAVVAREKDAAQEEAAGGCDSHGGQRLTLGRVVVHADAHVYELFDARGRLLVACAAKDAAVSEAVFSTLPGLGQATRRYAALPTSPLAATHLGTLRRVGWGGLAWVLVAADGFTELCSLRFALALTAGPVRFALSVPRPSTAACASTLEVRTRPPVFNTELGSFVSNFGCRVKRPSNLNFVAVEAAAGARGRAPAVALPAAATIDPPSCPFLRHGQVSAHEWVLDYRPPLTPLVALAVAVAVHARKTLAAAEP
jgi:hypothetical protein